jgi:hypothetical protein
MAAKVDSGEIELQSRLELSVLESLTRLSVEDLGHWNLRSYAFKNIDEHISRACDDEQPHLERFFLLLTIYKCLNRLLEPAKAPVNRELSPTEQLYRKRQRQKATRKTAAQYRMARIAKMNPTELAEFRTSEKARLAKYRKPARARLVPSGV